MNDKAPNAEPTNTQTKILDAAEYLFVEQGYAATSLRAIASAAGVNLAATHYYFGSKKGLFGS
ncbi:MAG: TetR/AcrR family transcriptional regulator, partial [Gammaproteobacteria bacterium]|nr:TetR/AcrR family transcriptional regulator [Gammaproteobacteria bacterium]